MSIIFIIDFVDKKTSAPKNIIDNQAMTFFSSDMQSIDDFDAFERTFESPFEMDYEDIILPDVEKECFFDLDCSAKGKCNPNVEKTQSTHSKLYKPASEKREEFHFEDYLNLDSEPESMDISMEEYSKIKGSNSRSFVEINIAEMQAEANLVNQEIQAFVDMPTVTLQQDLQTNYESFQKVVSYGSYQEVLDIDLDRLQSTGFQNSFDSKLQKNISSALSSLSPTNIFHKNNVKNDVNDFRKKEIVSVSSESSCFDTFSVQNSSSYFSDFGDQNTLVSIETPSGFNESTIIKTKKKLKKANVGIKRKVPFSIINNEYINRICQVVDMLKSNKAYIERCKALEQLAVSKNYLMLDINCYLFNIIPVLIQHKPNYFKLLQKSNNNDWIYEMNNNRSDKRLSIRWCGQRQNYYDAFLFRYKLDSQGSAIEKQGLCPYCPIDFAKNLDANFHTINDSKYMHHLCKYHGVYTVGYELDLPLVCKDETRQTLIICPKCEKKIIPVKLNSGFDNMLIQYFRHCFDSHNFKKQSRSAESKQKDAEYFKFPHELLLYEKSTSIMGIPTHFPMVYTNDGLVECNNEKVYRIFNQANIDDNMAALIKRGQQVEKKNIRSQMR